MRTPEQVDACHRLRSSKYVDEISLADVASVIAELDAALLDVERLDLLSNPMDLFRYKIRADGTVILSAPITMTANDLRSALDICIKRKLVP